MEIGTNYEEYINRKTWSSP